LMDARVAGILSGISYVSGIDYYKGINEEYAKIVGKRNLMPPNALMIMVSVDCDEYAKMLVAGEWQGVADYLAAEVDRLVAARCDFLCIASNTAHIAYPEIQRRYPELPVLHIADCTATSIKENGFTTVGLLGTEPTMRENYLKDRLALHGITTLVPDEDEDLSQIFQYIMDELGFNIFKPETRAFFLKNIEKLVARGAQGVILGCTEIELLVAQSHVPEVKLFRSAELHIAAAARLAARTADIGEFLP